MLTETYLEPSQKSTMKPFSLWLSHILNSTELRLGYIFYKTHPFMKKLTTQKTSGEKVFCKQWNLFFEIRNNAMEWRHQ